MKKYLTVMLKHKYFKVNLVLRVQSYSLYCYNVVGISVKKWFSKILQVVDVLFSCLVFIVSRSVL